MGRLSLKVVAGRSCRLARRLAQGEGEGSAQKGTGQRGRRRPAGRPPRGRPVEHHRGERPRGARQDRGHRGHGRRGVPGAFPCEKPGKSSGINGRE